MSLVATWPRVQLGDICNLVNGDAYRETDWHTTGVPIIRIQNLNDARKPFNHWQGSLDDRVVVNPGDVLLAWSGTPGTSFGAHLWERGFAILNQHIFRVDLDKTRADARFAVFAINEQLDEMIQRSHGAVGLRHVTKGEVQSLEIPLPPLAEQKRIAARLREQLAAAETARQAVAAQLAAARRLPSALLETIFAGSEADAWPRERLGTVLLPRNDIVHPYDKPKGRVQFVGLEHVEPHTGRRLGAVEVEQAELTGRKSRFFPGDIVYGYLRPYLNKVWIAEFAGLCSVDQYVYRIAPEQADTGFIAWFLRSPTYLRRAPVDVSPGQLPRIRMEEVAAVEIGLPLLAEQRIIAARLDAELAATAALRASLERRLHDLEKLPATLLREAFGGAQN